MTRDGSAGTRYEATIPDTLDLAERASLALNALLGNLEPAKSYGVHQHFTFGGTPKKSGLTWNLPAKNARALPWLRVMCGSRDGLDAEFDLMRTLTQQIRSDGLAYVPLDNDGAPRGTAYPFANGLLALAAQSWHERDGDVRWLDIARRLESGLRRIAIRVEDRAYYPPECSYREGEGWLWTQRGEAKIPYTPPEEPNSEQQGLEGCVKYEQAAPMRALVASHVREPDRSGRETLDQLRRFLLKPGLWEDSGADELRGNEHGRFAGHFHGNITALHALLEYAVAIGDRWLLQFVRESYEYARRTGIGRMGWFPGWLRPEEHHRSSTLYLASETCGVSDMLLLAVKLTDAGIGDYWDDVDSIVRNHLVAQQFDDLDAMIELAGGSQHAGDLRRFHGGFGQSMDGWIKSTAPRIFGCCTANGAIGLYYAWHGITRLSGETAVVNLLLNRASPWLDIDSDLPHQGRIRLHNKLARRMLVRLPFWIDRTTLRLSVNGKRARPEVAGSLLQLADTGPGDVIDVTFAVPESVETYQVGSRRYRVQFRASTVVNVTPRNPDSAMHQYYRRPELTSDMAPLRTVERFVADRILPLQ